MSIYEKSSTLYPHVFQLDTPRSSYVIGISAGDLAMHLYYGARLGGEDTAALCTPDNSPWFPASSSGTLLDHVPLEYSASGKDDLRPCALSVLWDDGDDIAELRYRSHRIIEGIPSPEGLPHVYAEKAEEAQTLLLTLADAKGLEVDLYYTVSGLCDAVIRRAVIRNAGKQNVTLLRVMSASEDLPEHRMDFIHLNGDWARECNTERLPLGHCRQRIESFRGASSHQHNPFAAIVSRDCTESSGEAYGFSLIYSGNFCIESDVDHYDQLRVNAGLNDRSFRWPLAPGETFDTPECVLVYSARGLRGMSAAYHFLYGKRVCRGLWRDRPRPVLLNTWEGLTFSFDHEKLMEQAKTAEELGFELFVIDDGWFGRRSDDKSSLGDWTPWEEKLGGPLPKLVEEINALGLDFGIWVEPEAISPNSDLYRAHPDWALCRSGRSVSLWRSQMILDLTRTEVQDYILEKMTLLLSSANISYVKWDMNRNMTEIGSAADPSASAGAVAHRYMLGVYRMMEILTSRFPKILFEGCAGGGGRFDAGILYYMPQVWTSDDSDAVQRMTIQGGASLVYPSSMMSCHISSSPNQQLQRSTSFEVRRNVALLGGGFGYELNVKKLSAEEREAIRSQIAEYKKERGTLFGSELYRLPSPENLISFQQISADGKSIVVTSSRTLYRMQRCPLWLRLAGLDPNAVYRCEETDVSCSGALLMGKGIPLPLPGSDFASCRLHFIRED